MDEETWRETQARLAAGARKCSGTGRPANPSALAGRVSDPDGNRMRVSQARKKNGTRYSYYVSTALVEGSVRSGTTGWRIPGPELERAVACAICSRLRDPGFLNGIVLSRGSHTSDVAVATETIASLADALDEPTGPAFIDALRDIVISVSLTETQLSAEFRLPGDPSDQRHHVDAPLQIARRGTEMRLVLQGAAARRPSPDPRLVRTIVEARSRVRDYVNADPALSLKDIAARENIDLGDLSRSLQFAFLAPDIVERILDGTQPASLTLQGLRRIGELPLLWDEQRELFC